MFLSTLLLFTSNLLCSSANASDNYIGLGPYQFNPQVSVSYEYRSNIFLTPQDTENNATTGAGSVLINPVVKFKLDGSTIKVLAGSSYNARVYLDNTYSDLNRFKDIQFIGSGRLFPNGKAGLQLSETFVISGREIESATDTTTVETGDGKDLAYVQAISSKTNLGLAFTPGPILSLNAGGSYGFQYVQNTSQTEDTENLNSKTDTGLYVDLHWKLLPKTTILILGSRNSFDWDNNLLINPIPTIALLDDCQVIAGNEPTAPYCYVGTPDGASSNMKVGLSGQISDNLILKAIAGMSSNSYSEESVISAMDEKFAGGYTSGERDTVTYGVTESMSGLEGIISEVGFTYFYTEKQQFSLMYNRGNQDAFFTNYSIFKEFKTTHVWKPNVKTNVTNLFNIRFDNYYGAVSRNDTKLTYSGNVAYAFTKRMNGRLGLGYRELINTQEEFQDQVTFRDLSFNAGLVWGY